MRKHVCNLANSEVLDSRKDSTHNKGGKIYRRRKCLKCLNGFATMEITGDEFTEMQRLKKLFAEMLAIVEPEDKVAFYLSA